VSYFSDWEWAQIEENGPHARLWAPELANVIKRMCHISVRISRGPRIRKKGREALSPRMSNVSQNSIRLQWIGRKQFAKAQIWELSAHQVRSLRTKVDRSKLRDEPETRDHHG
jgi:hypothetical protein